MPKTAGPKESPPPSVREAPAHYALKSIDTKEPVRITVDLDPDLHRRLKIKAAITGTSISDLIRSWILQNC